MSKSLVVTAQASSSPVLARSTLFAADPATAKRVFEFFTANIHNPNTRRAYAKATALFAAWCENYAIGQLREVQPIHIAAYIEQLGKKTSKPTVKQHLAALRMLFDWLVVGQIISGNPAHAVRGPKHSVKKGKTSVLAPEEMRQLLDSIDTTTLLGLRDRALIALMGFSFARVGAAITLKVEDYYIQKRRGWLRLQEKGGKQTEIPCNHNLEQYLDEWLSASGLTQHPSAPLFPSLRHGRLGKLNALSQPNVHVMIQRRALAAGLRTKISAHSFRATGITTYLQNGGKLEIAQRMAGHESARTTGLYDRRDDTVALDEVERILF
ncbi:tyrosine-type recombinase/integrase [Bryobacter aggregatus]|uniref:tyrosine-type recombinase/integrase n=1 Tax=Bryobacter aggregatus TaxID=360054 RepID=UPI0004E12113|nr:tyrosine-type recombinase/integrase [Bryobacter aggregatus]